MELSLSIQAMTGLLISLAILAAMPSVSVFTVSSRAALYGFRHGIAVTFGIVLADILFICLALYGMTLLLPWIGEWEWFIRFIAAGYLFWLAIHLWRRKQLPVVDEPVDLGRQRSLKTSFMMGLMVTLLDQKPILFYMGFFPAWLDLNLLTSFDTVIILLLTVLAVGGVKSIYAYLAATAGQACLTKSLANWHKLAAILLSIVGVMIVFSL